ncbi:hypothetical protein [Mycobacterium decipiens]|uniref:hypothetical protein n=1 Tax=Mycobacterium decipiens TaxID=1430326 RepID=UPI0010566138|nr:hypothetical protein [Mycobacterium decipiens]
MNEMTETYVTVTYTYVTVGISNCQQLTNATVHDMYGLERFVLRCFMIRHERWAEQVGATPGRDISSDVARGV